ncbi:pyridoxal 5'-phosphate synthase [Streptomyces sp. B1866]|uniref:pyridoxine/pyridoxamine 5'-phosphate oxidase n=1 Tax=Streptomyces sp. B1866 TaxID=3075431 RepID=UPI00288D742D|nr:pyridoxal 5'-phosphate synthase [Streptomyces sp. B1866]MDT3399455.1 pyridoxal 5'-phosphate synthase [Streptomyces sp. B1866]
MGSAHTGPRGSDGPGPADDASLGRDPAADGPATGPAAFAALLRSLPPPTAGPLPVWDPATADRAPLPLFRRWLREAAEAGEPGPHTMTLATADAEGRPSVRTVMLRGADERGWHFGTHRTSRKGRELAARPYAALGFSWLSLGRQVRVSGRVTAAGPEASAADLRGRGVAARASALSGERQSQLLGSYEDLVRASAAAWSRAEREPDAVARTWTLYAVAADEVEFYQEEARRRHVRLRYRRTDGGGGAGADGGWTRELLWP